MAPIVWTIAATVLGWFGPRALGWWVARAPDKAEWTPALTYATIIIIIAIVVVAPIAIPAAVAIALASLRTVERLAKVTLGALTGILGPALKALGLR